MSRVGVTRKPAAASGRPGQWAERARLLASRAIPLDQSETWANGRYAFPFAVWSTIGDAMKRSVPLASMKYTAEEGMAVALRWLTSTYVVDVFAPMSSTATRLRVSHIRRRRADHRAAGSG